MRIKCKFCLLCHSKIQNYRYIYSTWMFDSLTMLNGWFFSLIKWSLFIPTIHIVRPNTYFIIVYLKVVKKVNTWSIPTKRWTVPKSVICIQWTYLTITRYHHYDYGLFPGKNYGFVRIDIYIILYLIGCTLRIFKKYIILGLPSVCR